MIRFLTDEDLNWAIFDGVRRRLPTLDIVRVQDCGLRSYRDSVVLEFAASEDRIVLSHDVSTMEGHAYARIVAGRHMPGLFLIRQDQPVRAAIEEIVMIAECSTGAEWRDIVRWLPP